MVDIAALGFRINSDGTVTATNRLDKMTDASRRAERGAHGLEGASNRMGGALARLAKVAAGLGATLAAAFTVRNMAQMVDTWSDLSSQVGVAVRNMELAGPVMDRLADVARASYSDLNSTAEAFSRNSRVLTEMGYSIQGALDYTEALNNALVATATRGQRAEQVQNALSKALATGKLEAEGLESILTHGGAVAEVLADKLSVTTNELYRLRAEGKITGQVIAEALIENFDKLRDQAEKMPATLGDGMQIIGNSILYVTGLFDKAGNLSEGVASRLVSLGDRIKDNADAIVGAMRLVATTAAAAAVVFATKYVFAVGVTMVKATVSAIAQQTALNIALGATSTRAALAATAVKGLSLALGILRGALIALGWPALIIALGYATNKFMELSSATGSWRNALKALGDFAVTWARSVGQSIQAVGDRFMATYERIRHPFTGGASEYYAESARQMQQMAESGLARAWDNLGAPFRRRASQKFLQGLMDDFRMNLRPDVSGAGGASSVDTEAAAKKAKETESALASLRKEILHGTIAAERYAEVARKLTDPVRQMGHEDLRHLWRLDLADIQADTAERMKKIVEDQNEPFRRMADFGKQISDNLGQAVVYGQSLGGALVSSLRAAAAEAISSGIFRMLLGDGTASDSGLIGGVLGRLFGGFRADGGPVSPGKAYMVGERGPELYVPNAAGHVIANDNLRGGGDTIVNVDARGAVSPQALRQAVIEGVAQAMQYTDRSFASAGRIRPGKSMGA